MNVKESISYKCSKLWNLITTLISNLLLHIVQEEKIAAKIARVNRPKASINISDRSVGLVKTHSTGCVDNRAGIQYMQMLSMPQRKSRT